MKKQSWKLIVLVISFSSIITIIDTAIIYFEPVAAGWNIFSYIHYFGKSILIDILFFLSIFFISLLLFTIASKIIKRNFFKKNKVEKSISLSLSILIFSLIIYPVNYHLLPNLFAAKSIITNSILSIMIIPLSLLFYYFFFKLLDLLHKNYKILSIIIVGLVGVIISSSLIIGSKTVGTEIHPRSGFKAERTPNVIIITIDALRADHLSCYGYDKIETRNMDDFARESFLFTKAYSPTSWTTPSMMSMLTSKSPTVHGCVDYRHSAPLSMLSISQALKLYNYQTYGIVSNKQLYYKYGFSRGFDEYVEFGDIEILKTFKDTRIYLLIKMLSYSFMSQVGLSKDTTSWMTDKIKEFINNESDEPFFLWAHYLDPHTPYAPPRQYIPDGYEESEKTWEYLNAGKFRKYYDTKSLEKKDKASILNLYDGEILHVDEKLGEVISLLKEKGIYEDSLIIITSDHGEEFWEHGDTEHGHSLYKEVLHIPFLLKPPDYYKFDEDKKIIDTPISLEYIPNTIISFLGLPKYEEFGEFSLIDIIKDENAVQEPILSETIIKYPELRKIITENFSLIYNGNTDEVELYDLLKDPGELNDISSENSEITNELMIKLLEWIDRLYREKEKYGEADVMGMDSESLEEIRGLGYVE